MASNVWLRSIYHNTTGPDVTWTIEICDTETVAQVIRFESSAPAFSFEGLTQDLKPGIHPTMLRFGIFIRSEPQLIGSSYYGPSEGLITELFSSPEGRFRVKAYKDEALYFIGVILPDQCSYEDNASPYLMSITAVDGLYRLGSEEYVSEVGNIEYVTLRTNQDDFSEFSPDPLTDGLVGSEWILIEHLSVKKTFIAPFGNESYRVTTYARYEQHGLTSPGDGWVDQGGNLWALELDYFNEVIVDEDSRYHLTREIDNTPMRSLYEYIRKAMAIIPTADEYGEGVMWDVVNVWYETGMYDLTGDPFTQTRWSERRFAIGKKYKAVLEEILKHFYCRLYYANGRYHIEQISERGAVPFKRYCYDSEGTYLTSEDNVDLDISYLDEDLKVGAGGSFKALAPLRYVKVSVDLGGNNLLKDQEWTLTKQGARYLARLKQVDNDTRFLIHIKHQLGARFFSSALMNFPASVRQVMTTIIAEVTTVVWIRNIDTDTTYYLTPQSTEDFEISTWETDQVAGVFEKDMTIIGMSEPPFVTGRVFDFETLTAELPGDVNDSFDVYVSVNYNAIFNSVGTPFWAAHPDEYEMNVRSFDESLTTVDEDREPVNANLEKTYDVVNDLDNTVVVEVEAKFCDTGINDESIEIKSSASPISWRKSKAWNRNGEVTGSVELLTLLAQEICSLRTVPIRVYSGSFLTTLITTENRINRDGLLFLPLNVEISTDVDEISGDFVHLERVTPNNGGVVEFPDDGGPIDPAGPVGPSDGGSGSDGFFVLETDEELTSGSSYTESDIINTLQVSIESGNTVIITDVTTGDTQSVVLTQDITEESVVMYFESAAFTHTFPSGSLITLDEPDVTERPVYRFAHSSYNHADHTFPTYYDLETLVLNTKALVDDEIKIWRNGNLMRYDPDATLVDEYSIDVAGLNNKVVFPIEFENERIRIEAI